MKPRKIFSTYLCLFGLCCSLFVVGVFLICLRNILLHAIINSALILSSSSNVFSVWETTPFKLPLTFYFFNWTNPEDVYNSSVKPHFKEMGPYQFHEMKHKVNISWNDNGTVTFQQLRYWWSLDDNKLREEVTTVNPVALTAAYVLRDWHAMLRSSLDLFGSSQIHITRPVNEMLFDGYEDKMISLARSLHHFLPKSILPPWSKFGWFYSRNGSSDYDGVFNMGTGRETIFGKLYNWNYSPTVKHYEGQCSYVNGSAGELFPPYAKKTTISFYSPDMCRIIKLKFMKETKVNNILGYKYGADYELFDNGTRNPENKCYCYGECAPSGAVNVSSCKFGSPAFVSLPHFLYADPYYTNSIDGMEPNKDKHDLFITLEPTTGIPLEVTARLQINLLMQPIENTALYKNAPKFFVPMLWFEQSVKMPEDMIFNLRILVNFPVICIVIGVICILAALALMCFSVYRICTVNLCGRRKVNIPKEQVPLRSEQNKSGEFKKKPLIL